MNQPIRTAGDLLAAWDAQQTGLVEHRDERARCVVDVVAALAEQLDHPVRVLDLGCGPGSLTTAVCDRVPEAQVTAIDRDPVLLRLFRETSRYPSRITIVDADLRTPEWAAGFADGSFDAAVSATALHWLSPSELVSLHQVLGRVIAPGGIVLNADHLHFDEVSQPWIGAVADADQHRFAAEATQNGALDWDQWWDAAFAMPGWEDEAAEYHRRWSGKHSTAKVSPEFHLESLRSAGFAEVAQIWQYLNDRVVYGRRPRVDADS